MGSILEGYKQILSKVKYVPCDILAEPMLPVFSGMIKLRSLPILSQKKLQNWATRWRQAFLYFFVYTFAFACLDNFADEANAFSLRRAHKKCFLNLNSKFRNWLSWLQSERKAMVGEAKSYHKNPETSYLEEGFSGIQNAAYAWS